MIPAEAAGSVIQTASSLRAAPLRDRRLDAERAAAAEVTIDRLV